MPSIKAEQYEKNVKSAVDRWGKKLKEVLEKIEKIDTELAKLEAKERAGPLTADEQKLRAQCLAAREKLQVRVKEIGLELDVELMPFMEMPEAPKSDLERIGDKVKEWIKKYEKGVPLVGKFYLRPEIKVDVKKRTLKVPKVLIEWK